MPPLYHGFWYTSKHAMDLNAKLPILIGPAVHKTPEGFALLVFDRGGLGSSVNGSTPERAPAVMVPQNEEGHDLMTLVGDRAGRVTFDPASLPDLTRLVEYDHLPEGRKDLSVHKPRSKLA